MTDVHLPELMELDSYWENAIRDAAEDTIHSRKRLEFALHNRQRINKILESSGYKPAVAEMARTGRGCDGNENDSTDEDDLLTVSSRDTNLRPDLVDEVETAKSGASARRNCWKEKSKACFGGGAGKKARKRRVEFVRDSADEDRGDGGESDPSVNRSRINPCILRKRKLAVVTAEIKRKKRNANAKRHEKRAKNLRMKGKAYKTKRPRRKLDRESDNDGNRDGKQEQKTKSQETKVDNSNASEANANVNSEDIKKGSVAGKEVPVAKKVSQNGSKNAGNGTGPPKTEKDHSKGDCSQDPSPKERDISKCEGMVMNCAVVRGLPRSCAIKGRNRNCLGMRKMKCKQKRRRKKKKNSPFIKFYMTVYRELCRTCSIKSIAKEAAERWKCMSRKEKLKFYPRNYK